jgi:hypothetical protein
VPLVLVVFAGLTAAAAGLVVAAAGLVAVVVDAGLVTAAGVGLCAKAEEVANATVRMSV